MTEYEGFPSIARLNREVVVTEKIDGTSGQLHIVDLEVNPEDLGATPIVVVGSLALFAGSKGRYLEPTKNGDNYGFARWAQENAQELLGLGVGRHFGEWWGQGIQRGYSQDRKRFSLFNVHRWSDPLSRPDCCEVVPELWRGQFVDLDVAQLRGELEVYGSVAAPGFMNPEGFVVFHTSSGGLFKYTLDKNDSHKGAAA